MEDKLPCPTLPCDAPTVVESTGGLIELVIDLTDWAFLGFLVIAVIFILLAAFQFLMGGGNPQQVSEARLKLLWAGMAVGIAVFAKTIPLAIQSIITTTSG